LRHTFNNVCIRQYLNTQKLLSLSIVDPTWAARILLDRGDVAATTEDGALLVTRKSVHPTTIYTDHKVNDTCFELLPIQINDHIWFSVTNSNDLVHFSAEQEYKKLENRLRKKGILGNTLSQIQDMGSSDTDSVRSVYDSTTRKLSDGIESIRWSIIALVMWITIPILLVTILIVFCIYYTKFLLIRKASATAATALVGLAHTFAPKTPKSNRKPKINSILVTGTAPDSERLFVPRIYALVFPVTKDISPLPYIEVMINGIPVIALFDSGASISYVRTSSLTTLNGAHKATPSACAPARAANGSKVTLLGTVNLKVQTGSLSISHLFHISSDSKCPAPVLFGSDFIYSLNAAGSQVTLDLLNNAVIIGSQIHRTIQVNNVSPPLRSHYDIRLLHSVTLPKRSKNFIAAYVDGQLPIECDSILVEDNLRPSDSLYVVARCISSSENSQCSIMVLNPSSADIKLYKNMNIAKAFPMSPFHHQVSAVDTGPFNPYVPPEADWESKMPRFPVNQPDLHDVAQQVDLTQSDLTPNQKIDLLSVIRKHSNAFVGPDGHLGHYNGPIRHRIDLIDTATIPSRKVYRVPLEKRQEIERQIVQMLKDGIIRESTSPFCAPIVLVKKRDANSWRFTIDFRGLNAITKPQQSILPNIQDIIDVCANKCIYSSLDFQQGFHQIPLEETHCERTAFACFLGSFEYIRMPMGLKGAPATFQRIMDDFKKYLKAQVFIYIDDLIVTSETPEEHLHDLEEVLGKIQEIGMKL
uniref:Reverse transcriptase domain-containing protein n=1 Tax=Heligmosomoides polygyrus TaxID=6339 RepID=A0A183GK43_HELPZ